MDNYLYKICMNLGIKLILTNNKIQVLSGERKNNLTIIRAHKVFKNCPPNVAEAIVNYYSKGSNKEKNSQIIRDYLAPFFPNGLFKIKNLENSLIETTIRDVPEDLDTNTSYSLLTEFDISSITVSNFWGNEESKLDNSLSPSSNDILDLDIIIKPPVT